ncbi:MAG: glycosyltransferase family 9 protein [Candidatus Tectomicrobia bacterium]|nr:glycosyltransferase family 9 protein [Candidatus Tectomicrobia bacterium]
MSITKRTRALARSCIRQVSAFLESPRVAFFLGEAVVRCFKDRHGGKGTSLAVAPSLLVVRLDEIGDVVLTSAFLRELRRNAPDSWITLVVKPDVYNLVELFPYVNEVLTYDWRVARYAAPLQRRWRALWLSYRHLWRRRFDMAIVPRWDADYYHAVFLAYVSGADLRVGYSENVSDHKRQVNRGYDRLLTHPLTDRTLKHSVEHNLEVIRFLGGKVQKDHLELWLGCEDEAFAERALRTHGVRTDDLLIGFGPGSRSPKRIWPLSGFVELSHRLGKEYDARIIVVGGSGEEPLGQELQKQLGAKVINAVGKATLRQTAALLKRCHVYVGNDSGPMHLAAAAGVPVVEISGHPKDGASEHPNSPLRFGPWGVPHIVLQPEAARMPCIDACTAAKAHCILAITVEQVRAAVSQLLENKHTSCAEVGACPADVQSAPDQR